MRLRFFKDFYVMGLVMTGLVLLSFYRFNYETPIITNTCKYPSAIADGQVKCNLPADYITDSDHVTYPWIGDPTCQHFPVQVNILFAFSTRIGKFLIEFCFFDCL